MENRGALVHPSVEIERKWLVNSLPQELIHAQATTIRQGYLSIAEDGSEVRLRSRSNPDTGKESYFLTVKKGQGLVRTESEVEISEAQFTTLWPATADARVEKSRYKLAVQEGHLLELDVFTGKLEGLIIAEVEFRTRTDAAAFIAPEWCVIEITEDSSYKNQRLARYGRPD